MSNNINQSQEELLEKLHNNYINIVNESGLPLWVYDMYCEGMYNPDVEESNDQLESEDDISNPLPF